MSQIFYAPTEDFIKLERGQLNADASAGTNVTLTLISNDSISIDDFIVIGYEGSELVEMAQVNATVTPGPSIRVATLLRDYKKGTPVTLYRYNQRKFYGSATSDGSYTELTSDGSPKNIQVDDPQGTFIEYTGSDYLYFKATYYNSSTDTETDIDDGETVSSTANLRYATISNIRKHAGINGNAMYSNVRVEEKRSQAENEINSALLPIYVLPLTEVPGLIRRVCELLAAGYIDYEEFGQEGEGVKWLGEARAILKSIAEGRQKLIGTNGQELTTNGKVSVLSGFPDGSTETGASDDRKFTLGQRF